MHNRLEGEGLPGVTACLADLETIATAYVRQVRTLTGYANSVVSDDDLHQTARTTLRLLFEMIKGEDRLAELQEYSENIGRRRARQQVPLESLLRAVRMDFPFIWEALSAHTAGGASAISDSVVWIWNAVERHTTNVQTGYLDEISRVNAELELERNFLLRQLLSEGSRDPQLHRQAAAALGLPADGEFVVVVSGDQSSTPTNSHGRSPTAPLGHRYYSSKVSSSPSSPQTRCNLRQRGFCSTSRLGSRLPRAASPG